MSVEVDMQSYQFLRKWMPLTLSPITPPRAGPSYIDRLFKPNMDLPTGHIKASSRRRRPKEAEYKIPPFRYNPLHDLESLWWIAADFVVGKEVVAPGDGEPPEPISRARRKYAADLFNNYETRLRTISEEDKFLDDTDNFSENTEKLIIVLDKLREALHDTYCTLEYDFSSPDTACANALVDSFAKTFEIIANAEEIQPLTVQPFPPPAFDIYTFRKDPDPSDSESSSPSQGSKKRRRGSGETSSFAAEPVRQVKKVKAIIPRRPYLPRRAKERT